MLERRVHELEESGRQKDLRIAELEAKTDFTLAIGPLQAWTEMHERRAQERHESVMRAQIQLSENSDTRTAAMLSALEAIVARLPAENEGD